MRDKPCDRPQIIDKWSHTTTDANEIQQCVYNQWTRLNHGIEKQKKLLQRARSTRRGDKSRLRILRLRLFDRRSNNRCATRRRTPNRR